MVTVKQVSDYIYVRQAHTDTKDIVRKVAVLDQSSANYGTVDFSGTVTCLSTSTDDPDVIYASPLATLNNSADNAPPIKINNAFVGGTHSIPSRALTKASHGLTATDVGDVGTDSAAKSWVLTEIIDADTIRVSPANTGGATEWTLNGLISGSTITFTGAGAFTFTANVSSAHYPFNQNYSRSYVIDGLEVTDLSTAQTGSVFEVRESYDIPNCASFLSDIIADYPTATPLELNDNSIQSQVQIEIFWRFDSFGGRTSRYTAYNEQDYSFGANDYIGAMQSNRSYASDGGSGKMLLYIPGVPLVDGYAFADKADVTSNASTVIVEDTDCDDTADPASHFAEILTTSADSIEFGHVFGYRRNYGVGQPAIRSSLCSRIFDLSSSEKLYPAAVSDKVQPSGGETYEVETYDAFYDMVSEPDYTVNKCVEFADGRVHWLFDCHKSLSSEWIALPSSLVGRAVKVLDSSGSFSLLSGNTVDVSGLKVSVSGGYGRAIVEISAAVDDSYVWKGAVQPPESSASGNQYNSWRGAVEPSGFNGVSVDAGYDVLALTENPADVSWVDTRVTISASSDSLALTEQSASVSVFTGQQAQYVIILDRD